MNGFATGRLQQTAVEFDFGS